MVLHKRSEYGFHGYQIPTMPRGCRSSRKKRPIRCDAELCAIDLLATVAGKLLLEKENPTASPRPMKAKAEAEEIPVPPWTDNKKAPVKAEPCDQGSCDEGTPVIRCQKLSHKHAFKETNNSHAFAILGLAAPASSGGCRVDALKSKNAADVGSSAGPVHSPGSAGGIGPSHSPKMEDKDEMKAGVASMWICNKSIGVGGIKVACDQEHYVISSSTVMNKSANAMTDEQPMDVDREPKTENPVLPPHLPSSDSSVEVGGGDSPRLMRRSSSIPRFRGKSSGDDDDGSSACTHPSSVSSRAAASFRPQRIGDRRIRKLISSRFWKVGPVPLNIKDGEFYERDGLRSKKLWYTRQKTQRSSFKRKKLMERSFVSPSGAGMDAETISKLSCNHKGDNNANKKCIKGEQENRRSSSISSSHRTTSFKAEDYKVKLKIKSFKVPELLIEMPETATVGSLKRAVLETVTAMLGNGLKVGMIYQGRKVRDDCRSLLQAGITGGDKLDSLNFSLEPNGGGGGAAGVALEMAPGSSSSLCRAETLPVEPLSARLPALLQVGADTSTGNVDGHEQQQQQQQLQPKAPTLAMASPPGWKNKSGKGQGDSHAHASGSGAIVAVSSSPSKALVTIHPPPCSSSELTLAAVNKTTRRPETAQRRIRRPFSVAEVEALVQAVEKLGTGRWRDVKLQAFENAEHRTYVDLKDKWKTLVHTARISPQQRRGEPVPQVLLDRVLVAHAHWSQHQARLQSSKHASGSGVVSHPQQQPSAGLFLPLPPPPPPPQPQAPPQPAALI